jgi:hypothetical protein
MVSIRNILLALLLSLPLLLIPSVANAATCPAINWGSLPKDASAMGTGEIDTGYNVRYVDKVTADGSGLPVVVPGGARLQVIVRHPNFHGIKVGASVANVTGYRTFRSVVYAGSFEGQTTYGLGVRSRVPFRVFTIPGGHGRIGRRLSPILLLFLLHLLEFLLTDLECPRVWRITHGFPSLFLLITLRQMAAASISAEEMPSSISALKPAFRVFSISPSTTGESAAILTSITSVQIASFRVTGFVSLVMVYSYFHSNPHQNRSGEWCAGPLLLRDASLYLYECSRDNVLSSVWSSQFPPVFIPSAAGFPVALP